MEKLKVIGLTGYKGHGKSTVARLLVRDYGYTQLSYGTAVKAMARRINPVVGMNRDTMGEIRLSEAIEDFPNEIDLKTHVPEYRRFIQYLATEGIRHITPNYWVDALDKELGILAEKGITKFVIDDVRFPNETKLITAEFLGDNFHRTGLWHVFNPKIESETIHESESHVGNLGETFLVQNDGSFEDLSSKIEQAMEGRLSQFA